MPERAAPRSAPALSSISERGGASVQPKAPAQLDQSAKPPLTEEESLLAERLQAHIDQIGGRSHRPLEGRPKRWTPVPSSSNLAAGEAEEIAVVPEDAAALPDFMLPQLSSALDEDEPAEDLSPKQAGRAVPPPWLSGAGRSSWRQRCRTAFSWLTTIAIVGGIFGGAFVGLVGYGRSVAMAEAAYGRAVEIGRVIGLIAA